MAPPTEDLPPAEKRRFTFEEVVLMLDGWADDWHKMEDGETNADAVRGWVEHMDAGGLPVGVGE